MGTSKFSQTSHKRTNIKENLLLSNKENKGSTIPSNIYRIIHKSLRDVRHLRYSSQDGHTEGEHVSRGRDTPKVLSYLTGAQYVFSAVSVLVVAQPSSEVLEGIMNYPVCINVYISIM
jgi:hypothetical protein